MAQDKYHYHEDIIKHSRPYLSGRFNVIDVLDDKFIQDTDCQKIQQDVNNHGQIVASSNLLDILMRCPSSTFVQFTKALWNTEYKHLVTDYIINKVPDKYKDQYDVYIKDETANQLSEDPNREGAVGGMSRSQSCSPNNTQPKHEDGRRKSADDKCQQIGGLQKSPDFGKNISTGHQFSVEDNTADIKEDIPMMDMIQEQSEELVKFLEDKVDYQMVVKKLPKRHYQRVKDFPNFASLMEDLDERGWTVGNFVNEIVLKFSEENGALRDQILDIIRYRIPEEDAYVVNQDPPNNPSVLPRASPNLPIGQQCQDDQSSCSAEKNAGLEAVFLRQDLSAEVNTCIGTVSVHPESDPDSERSLKSSELEGQRLGEDRMAACSGQQNLIQTQLENTRQTGNMSIQNNITESWTQADEDFPSETQTNTNFTGAPKATLTANDESSKQLNYTSISSSEASDTIEPNEYSSRNEPNQFLYQSRIGLHDSDVSSSSMGSAYGDNLEVVHRPDKPSCPKDVTLDSFSQKEESIPKTPYKNQSKDRCDARPGGVQSHVSPSEDQPAVSHSEDQPDRVQPDVRRSEDQSDVSPSEDQSDVSLSRVQPAVSPIEDQSDVSPSEDQSDVSPSEDQSDVSLIEDQPDVSPRKVQPDVSPSEVQPDVSLSEDQTAVSPSEDQPDVSPSEDQPAVSPSEVQPDVSPSEDQSDVSPSEVFRPDVSPSKVQPDVSPSGDQPAVSPSEDQPDVSPSEDQSDVSPSEDQSDVSPSEDQSDVSPSEDQSDVSHIEDQPAVSPSGDQPDVSPSEDQPAVSPSEDQPAVSPNEVQPDASPSEDQSDVSLCEDQPDVSPSEVQPDVSPSEDQSDVSC